MVSSPPPTALTAIITVLSEESLSPVKGVERADSEVRTRAAPADIPFLSLSVFQEAYYLADEISVMAAMMPSTTESRKRTFNGTCDEAFIICSLLQITQRLC